MPTLHSALGIMSPTLHRAVGIVIPTVHSAVGIIIPTLTRQGQRAANLHTWQTVSLDTCP